MTIQSKIVAVGIMICSFATAQVIPPPSKTVSITSSPPYNAIGELYILQVNTNQPALHNPVLLVEGFDIGNDMNWPELYVLLNQENLVLDIQQYKRDLIILNFGDSTVDILANSALTEAAIKYVNANRASQTDKFTAIGSSLGGLTLRKALVDMSSHGVDTWVSFDAPHEGANIPLGVQEFFEYFSTVNVADFDPIREFLVTLDSMASRQMLLTHHSHSPDAPAGSSAPERQSFVDAMNASGYPTNCKIIAISNGSGYGEKLPFNSGDLMLHWEYYGGGFFDPNIVANIYALPQSAGTASTVFNGDFTALVGGRPPKTVSSYHPLSFDNAPGGYRSSVYQLFTNLPPSYIDGNDYVSVTNHCFIPTVSALGIPIGNIESNLVTHSELLALSPFDEIHYAVTNEPHVDINPHNKRWFMRAVLEGHDSDGDGYDDYQEYILGTDFDSPDSKLSVHAVIEVGLSGGLADLSWETFSNAQYEVSFVNELGETWQLLETIPPTTDALINRQYVVNTNLSFGFFKITGTPKDPITD